MTALRSGDYAQTTWRLARDEGDAGKSYCCEGVAFERYHTQFEGFNLEWVPASGETVACMRALELVDGKWLADHANAPLAFWDAMGMRAVVGRRFAFALPDDLTTAERDGTKVGFVGYDTLNDDGLTFDQIADLIQWQFLGGENAE